MTRWRNGAGLIAAPGVPPYVLLIRGHFPAGAFGQQLAPLSPI